MQRFCAIVALMVLVASPAFAQSASKAQKQRSLQPSSYGSYGGQKRYTDPDPNIDAAAELAQGRVKYGAEGMTG